MATPDLALDTIEKKITAEELAAMGDVGRCELVEGELIKMSPTGWRHGRYEYRLGNILGNFVDERQLGEIMVGEVGIYTGREPDTVRGADLIFISYARLDQVTSPSFLDVAPELIVEIVSPDDRWTNIKQKLQEYFAIGVERVWLVDPSDQSVAVYRSLTDVRLFTGDDALPGETILPGFSLPVSTIFAD